MNVESGEIDIELTLNGEQKQFRAYPMERVLDVLRENFRLTGTKEGCGEGECGACSILLNGTLVNSCLVPAIQVRGAVVKTIEGTAVDGTLHSVQQAFIEHGGAQCGICTPGMVMAAVNLLDRNPQPTEGDIREALAGNLCRCTGYIKIFNAVLEACKEGSRAL
jgi:carbon-monoxide dehydrogenase small subunit